MKRFTMMGFWNSQAVFQRYPTKVTPSPIQLQFQVPQWLGVFFGLKSRVLRDFVNITHFLAMATWKKLRQLFDEQQLLYFWLLLLISHMYMVHANS